MARRGNWQQQELECLVDGLTEHYETLFGKLSARLSNADKNGKYNEILLSINAVSDVQRTKEDLLKKWTDLKSRTKRKEQLRLKLLNQSGSGVSCLKPLSTMEEKVLALIPKVTVEGLDLGADTFANSQKRKITPEEEPRGETIEQVLQESQPTIPINIEDMPSQSIQETSQCDNSKPCSKKAKKSKNECHCSEELLDIERQMLTESKRRNDILENILQILIIKIQHDTGIPVVHEQ